MGGKKYIQNIQFLSFAGPESLVCENTRKKVSLNQSHGSEQSDINSQPQEIPKPQLWSRIVFACDLSNLHTKSGDHGQSVQCKCYRYSCGAVDEATCMCHVQLFPSIWFYSWWNAKSGDTENHSVYSPASPGCNGQGHLHPPLPFPASWPTCSRYTQMDYKCRL